MSKNLSGTLFSMSDIGKKRATNEDEVCSLINSRGHILMCVCDGLGGHNKGNFASFAAIEHIKSKFENRKFFLTKLWLRKIIQQANKIIFEKGNSNPNYKGTGTTLSLALIFKRKMFVAQIGDSRVCSMNNNGEFIQLTEDETVAMHAFRTGEITKEQVQTHPKRHILTNALGIHKNVKVSISEYKYQKETILVCSDGLYNNVSNNQIISIIKGNDSTSQKVVELINQANFNGGSDNIAVCIWEANN